MTRLAALALILTLAACGADGPPTRPEPKEERKPASTSISISGQATIGVSGGS